MSVLDQATRRPHQLVNESWPYEPFPERRGFYTQSKLEAERIVVGAINDRGLPAVILRPGQIFGPGAEAVTPSGVIGLAGRWIVVGSGKLPLPLVYVEDVVDALMMAAERTEALGSIIQIVDRQTVSQHEYISKIKNSSKPDLKVLYVPQGILLAAGVGFEALGRVLKRSMPLSRYRIRSIRPLANFDTQLAHERLGWTPRIGSRAALLGSPTELHQQVHTPEIVVHK
jgi:nucleoside-diphosphate-sugar epimerase